MTYNFNNDDDDDDNNMWEPTFNPYDALVQIAKNQEVMSRQLMNLGKSYQINHDEINAERNHRNILYQNEVMLKEAYDNHQKYIKAMEIDVSLMKETIFELQDKIRRMELAAVKNKYKGE